MLLRLAPRTRLASNQTASHHCQSNHKLHLKRASVLVLSPLQRQSYASSSTNDQPKPPTAPAKDDTNFLITRTKKKPLLPLGRPLGLPSPPSTVPLTKEEKYAKYLDDEKIAQERKHLLKELSTDYYEDYYKLSSHDGKTWIAPKVLIREDRALYFPDIEGKSLVDSQPVHSTNLCKGHVTVVNIINSRLSQTQIRAFGAATLERFGDNALFRYMQINLQENALKSFLVSLFMSNLRGQTPPALHSTYMLSHQNMEYLKAPLGLDNKFVGYVYLLDENCKIRWAGCGDVKDDEAVALERCTDVLLKRLEKEKGRGKDNKYSQS